jgi:hypothetical protein
MTQVQNNQVNQSKVSRQPTPNRKEPLFKGPWNEEFRVSPNPQTNSYVAHQRLTANEKQLIEEMKHDIEKKSRSDTLKVCQVRVFNARKIDKLCSTFFEIDIGYELFSKTLKEEIELRRNSGNKFNGEFLSTFAGQQVASLMRLESFDRVSYQVVPKLMFVDPFSLSVKLFVSKSTASMPLDVQKRLLTQQIMNGESVYNSPNFLKINKKSTLEDVRFENMFCLCLILLEMGCLDCRGSYFDSESCEFQEIEVYQRLELFAKRYNKECPGLVSFVEWVLNSREGRLQGDPMMQLNKGNMTKDQFMVLADVKVAEEQDESPKNMLFTHNKRPVSQSMNSGSSNQVKKEGDFDRIGGENTAKVSPDLTTKENGGSESKLQSHQSPFLRSNSPNVYVLNTKINKIEAVYAPDLPFSNHQNPQFVQNQNKTFNPNSSVRSMSSNTKPNNIQSVTKMVGRGNESYQFVIDGDKNSHVLRDETRNNPTSNNNRKPHNTIGNQSKSIQNVNGQNTINPIYQVDPSTQYIVQNNTQHSIENGRVQHSNRNREDFTTTNTEGQHSESENQIRSKSQNRKREPFVSYDIEETNRYLDERYKLLTVLQDEVQIDRTFIKLGSHKHTEIEQYQEILTHQNDQIVRKTSAVNRWSVYPKDK